MFLNAIAADIPCNLRIVREYEYPSCPNFLGKLLFGPKIAIFMGPGRFSKVGFAPWIQAVHKDNA